MNETFIACAALALFASLPAAAQSGMAGSPGAVAVETAVVGGGGSAASAAFAASVHLGSPALVDSMSSPSFALRGGVTLFPAVPPGPAPLVFGVAGGGGSKDGGSATVLGFNLVAPGAGAPAVSFGGAPAGGEVATSNTTVTLVAPAGLNALGNPLGAVDVALSNGNGAAVAPGAHVYLPALLQDGPFRVGELAQLSLHAAPGDLVVIAFGLAIPGLGVPIPPIDGKLELLLNATVLTPLVPTAGVTLVQVPLPAKPALAGKTIDLQGVALSQVFPDLVGSWTNRLAVTFEP